MMPDLIANSVFKKNGVEYRPGDIVSPELPGVEKLMEEGFVVYRGGMAAAKKAIAEAKAEEEARAAEEAARKEAEETARKEAEGKAAAEKSVKGRKAKVEI